MILQKMPIADIAEILGLEKSVVEEYLESKGMTAEEAHQLK